MIPRPGLKSAEHILRKTSHTHAMKEDLTTKSIDSGVTTDWPGDYHGFFIQRGAKSYHPIGLLHNGGQIKCSFVLMLISLSSLAATSKFQKNFCFKMRAVGLITVQRALP